MEQPPFDFTVSGGFGHYKNGSHWYGKGWQEKMASVLGRLFFLYLFTLSIVTGVKNPFMSGIALLFASAGTGWIFSSWYRIHGMIHRAKKNLSNNPELGKWSLNYVSVTRNAQESNDRKFMLIAKAERSIEISGSYMGGKIFDTLLDLLEKKIEESPHIQIRVLSESVWITKKNRKKIAHVVKKYPKNIAVLLVKHQWICVPQMDILKKHAKIVIIDGTSCIVGGSIINDRWLHIEGKKNFKRLYDDMDLVVQGPLAETLQREFFTLMRKWLDMAGSKKYGENFLSADSSVKGEVPTPVAVSHALCFCSLVTGSYEQGSANECKQAYISMIRRAQKSIALGHMIYEEKEILAEIKQASERGIAVTIMTDWHFEKVARRAKWRVGEYYTCCEKPWTYHKKVMVVDEMIVVMGSFNLSQAAATTNDELIVVVHSSEVAKETLAILQEDIATKRKL